MIIGIKNTGAKAAREVTVNLVVPRGGKLQWALEPWSLARETPERLAPVDGEPDGPEGQWISERITYVGRRSHYEVVGWFEADVASGDSAVFPMRCRVESDDLDEDEDEPTCDALITVIGPPFE